MKNHQARFLPCHHFGSFPPRSKVSDSETMNIVIIIPTKIFTTQETEEETSPGRGISRYPPCTHISRQLRSHYPDISLYHNLGSKRVDLLMGRGRQDAVGVPVTHAHPRTTAFYRGDGATAPPLTLDWSLTNYLRSEVSRNFMGF